MNTVPSSYSVAITVGDEYGPGTLSLKKAIGAVLEILNVLKEKKWKGASLYYSASGALLNPDGDYGDSSRGTASKGNNIVDKV